MEQTIETQHGKFIVRPYMPEDEKGVLSLWHVAFGREMDPRVWRWKYLENPYGFQIMLCVTETGIPVAMYAGIPYKANLLGKTVQVTHLMDNMSDPAYRGVIGGRAGLLVRTAYSFRDHYAGVHESVFIYGLPGRRHFMLGKLLMKFAALAPGVSYLQGPTAVLSEKLRAFRGKIEQITTVDESFDRVFEKNIDHYPFSLRRDAAFIGWRFAAHPENKYEIWGYKPCFGKRLKSYAVFSFDGNKAQLVDMLAPPSSSMIKDFLGRIGAEFVARDIEFLAAWFPSNHFLAKAAIYSGLKPQAEPLGIIPAGWTFDPKLSFKWSSENIFYTIADADVL